MAGWNTHRAGTGEGAAVIPAVYLEHDGETWSDAGDYELKLTAKFAILTRARKSLGFLPGAIDAAEKIKICRENWDAGKRKVSPQMAGIPLVFLASGAKEWRPSSGVMTQADIRAMF